MKLSIVILTCNQSELTSRCLRSLGSLISSPDCEVILVDNGSGDGTCEAVGREFPGVKLIRLESNIGVAPGRNRGLQEAQGEHLMILDNDTVASPEAIMALSDYLDGHPDVGLVAPRLVSPQGAVQTSFKDFPGIGVKLRNVLSKHSATERAEEIPMEDFEPFYVIGAAQMFTREVWKEAGPLDDRIIFGPEDADFCMAVRKAGYRVVYTPCVTIIHDWQRYTSRHLFSKTSRRHLQGLLYFYRKHRRWL